MAADVTAEAVVLRRSQTGETDRRLTLLTKEHGKIDVVAKGARKAGSRLAGSSEPMVRAVFTWAEGRNRRFVTQVQPVTSYPHLRDDYDKSIAALALLEIIAASLPYESPNPYETDIADVFDHCTKSLEFLERAIDWSPVIVWSEVKLLELEGMHPDWTSCSVTGQGIQENPTWVSPSAGGMVLSSCADRFGDRFLASAEALIALKKVGELSDPPDRLKGASECLRILFLFWRHTLESKLPANETMLQGLPDLTRPPIG